jgi:hypothetical protein
MLTFQHHRSSGKIHPRKDAKEVRRWTKETHHEVKDWKPVLRTSMPTKVRRGTSEVKESSVLGPYLGHANSIFVKQVASLVETSIQEIQPCDMFNRQEVG